MRKKIQRHWEERPVALILCLAVLFRLVAVIFAKGWGMIDDHFLVIEPAQSFLDLHEYNNWLPGSPANKGPTGHNLFYPGLHFLLFSFFRFIHLEDPQVKMLIVRFLHAAWSLVTVYFGYKITERLSGRHDARLAGIILALFWIMPWLSVRNLVEVVCIPFLVLAVWFIISRENQAGQTFVYFLAGLFLGLAFNIRPQTAFFSIGMGVATLVQRKWRETLALTVGSLFPVLLIQGVIDYFIWGRPFAELPQYVRGNLGELGAYVVLPWYQYFIVVLGFLLPPVSFFLFFGFLRNWRRHLILFLAVAFFFIFHSAILNKQERFILPILPFIIISGTIGWNRFISGSQFWQKRPNLHRGCWIFFWTLNLLFLPVVSTVYSKRAQAETMTYLSGYPDVKCLLVTDANNNPEQYPKFYLGQWPAIYDVLTGSISNDSLFRKAAAAGPGKQPRFILFSGEKDLQQRVKDARKYFPFIVYETTIEPGNMDRLLHRLNPNNKNYTVTIYRNTCFISGGMRK